MENHYFDAKGMYTGSASANAGTLPPDCALRTPPPKRKGFWPVLNADRSGWELVEDHRGEEGWRGGIPATISEIGPLPEGWTTIPPESPETSNRDELRQIAYQAEADPIRDLALSYQVEAAALRLEGDAEGAALAEEKQRRELGRYIGKKKEIRARYPKEAAEPGADKPAEADTDARYFLTRSGTYHRPECGYTKAGGEWMRLSVIRADHPDARPCSRCRPDREEKG